MTVMDIHPHIIANDTKRYLLAPLGGHQSDWSRTRPVTTEQMIAAMDKAGVAKAAIVQASTCYGHDNSYVAHAVAAHPHRFTGVFSVDGLAPHPPQRNFTESRKGKATPETFFPKLVSIFGASRIAWGSNYPSSEGSLSDLLALATTSLKGLPASDQEWIFAKTAQTLYPALA